MPLIVFKDREEAVAVTITVTGPVWWRYDYRADNREFRRSGSDDQPRTFDLGPPSELHMDHNAWVVHVVNDTDRDVKYKAKFTWTQGDTKLKTWSRSGTLEKGKHASHDADALLFQSSR